MDGEARRWGLVVGDNLGGMDLDATQAAFLAEYPERDPDEVRDMIGVAVELAARFARDGDPSSKDYEFPLLFQLVRKLKAKAGAARDKRGPEGGEYFFPYGRVFRDALQSHQALPRHPGRTIDWTDDELLALKFADTWENARSAEGEDLLAEACEFAHGDSLVLDGYGGLRFRLLVAMAHYLQTRQGAAAILLPQEKLGRLLGVSANCIGYMIRDMIRRKLLKVTSGEFSFADHKAKEYRFIGKIARRGRL